MIKINSREEILSLNAVWWERPNRIRINQYGIFYLDNDVYPKYFKYIKPYDSHSCGSYVECTQNEYKEYLADEIKNLQEEIKKLQKMLDNEI